MEAATAPVGVALALLGGWRLSIDGLPASPPAYEKGRALLAYLAMENRWLSRDALAAMFWPDSLGHRANLRQVLANLRAVLNDGDTAAPCLLVRRDAIAVGPECAARLDVAAFLAWPPRCAEAGSLQRCAPCLQQMEAAERLYSGEFMAGFTLADCPEFEEWLHRKRESLRRHAVALCGRLADCHERYGEREQALAFARRATELDHWDEAAQRRLMRFLAASGQLAAALKQYEALETSLAREVGVLPEEATRALHGKLRNGDKAGQEPAVAGPRTVAGGGSAEPPQEVRRVVVLQVEPDLTDDESDLLEPGRLPEVDALFDDALARWNGQRYPTAGLALGAVFGLAEDGEQAPRRALQAAREIAARPEFRRTRIGICEGRALIGADPGPSIAASPLPALAQRLALCGEPGDIIAAAGLAAGTEPDAAFDRLPRRRFTGLAGEHTPCRLTGLAGAKYQPYPAAFATPFVGREEERRQLGEALAAAGAEGRVRFVELIGLPGTGKSRLLAELAREHRERGGEVRWVRHRPELRYVSLGGLRENLRERIGPLGDNPGGTAGDDARLDAWLAKLPTATGRLALRAPLKTLLARDPQPAGDASGRSMAEVLLTLMFAPSRREQPVLLVLDDLHWADEATRELLQAAMKSAPASPLLAILAGRPAGGVQGPARSAVPRTTLRPLALAESQALIAAIDADGRIAPARRSELARMSGGLPLYAEYIARTARDQPVSGASLFGVLQGVLDRLGSGRCVLQAASVFGTNFSEAALRVLLPNQAIGAALEQAAALAISRCTGDDHHAFRHALLRDCAYESIPPRQRREWHRRAAAWLSQRPGTPPADIAQHLEAAHAWREARKFWSQAAETAYLGEFAGDAKEAAVRALAAAEKDDAPLSAGERAELELLAGYAALMTQGYGAKEARRFFAPTAARTDAELPPETLFRALSGMAAAIPQGRSETLAIMQRLEAMAATPAHRMMVGYGYGSLLFWRGEFAASLRHFDAAIAIGEDLPAREWLRYSADSPVVACHALKGINLAFSGDGADACAASARALADARRDGRAHGLCFALTMAASVHLVLDRPADVERLAAEGLELAAQRHFPLWHAYNTLFGMWAKARQGRLRMRSSFRLISMHREFAAASRLSPVTSLWFVASIFEALGQWTLTEATVGRALALAENGGDRYCMPDLLRQKGLARHARGDLDGARRWLDQALALADAIGSHGLKPRIVRSIGHLARPGAQEPPPRRR